MVGLTTTWSQTTIFTIFSRLLVVYCTSLGSIWVYQSAQLGPKRTAPKMQAADTRGRSRLVEEEVPAPPFEVALAFPDIRVGVSGSQFKSATFAALLLEPLAAILAAEVPCPLGASFSGSHHLSLATAANWVDRSPKPKIPPETVTAENTGRFSHQSAYRAAKRRREAIAKALADRVPYPLGETAFSSE